MTALLEKAMNHVNALPPEEQDAVASLILEEIESEKRWDELFAGSQGQLAQLAGQAIAESVAVALRATGRVSDSIKSRSS